MSLEVQFNSLNIGPTAGPSNSSTGSSRHTDRHQPGQEPPPRYLFRVACPASDGQTDTQWVKSKAQYLRDLERDHRDDRPGVQVAGPEDLLHREDREATAQSLIDHLRWRRPEDDNLVSWTSSFLFVAQHVMRRRKGNQQRLEDISVLVVDTAEFPTGTFTREMNLARPLREYNNDLSNFCNLENTACRKYPPAHYYNGEYLSHGALHVQGKCTTVTARDLFDAGLRTLRPDLELDDHSSSAGLAKEICRMRQAYYHFGYSQNTTTDEQYAAIHNIANLFGRRFYLPMVANLLGLMPCLLGGPLLETSVEQLFPVDKVNYQEKVEPHLRPVTLQNMHPFVPAHLPEVAQVKHISRLISCRIAIGESMSKYSREAQGPSH
ncbi:hypothetical protein BDZ85DRAFT_255912 [Elsinoe ampelina]|uniref:DUF7587 domain-containing protein n=1 Tax=Elsinoe ampelina TaxID=302913 RepID=A0A6A6GKN6_9PEZI|nr:hypothetical protein BDZ85DRAFT_255912 [Elsinoe ampelina]